MRIAQFALIAHSGLIFTSCGFGFGPGASMYNEGLFEESPHIVMRSTTRTASYALRWTYGSQGFYFRPEAKVIHGQLCFSLQATSSSGNLSGQKAEIAITDRRQIEAIERHGAFWLEPNGEKVRLEVKKL